MIKDDALAQRLNAVKKGEEIPIPPAKDVYFKRPDTTITGQPIEPIIDETLIPKAKPGMVLAASSYNLLVTFSMALLFGVGAKALFSTDWNFWGMLGVGVIINQGFNLISRLKLFN